MSMVEDVSYILQIHLYGLCQLNDTLIIMQSTFDYIDYDNVRGPEWLNGLGSWIT